MRWYVVNTLANQEERAELNLRQQGFESWLPRLARTRRHARRVEEIKAPMFPGYLFVRFDLDSVRWRSINGTFGVRRLLCSKDKPAPVADTFIDTLRGTLDERGLVAVPAESFKAGQKVRLVRGPFSDLVATLLRLNDRDRASILLHMLGRDVHAIVSTRALSTA